MSDDSDSGLEGFREQQAATTTAISRDGNASALRSSIAKYGKASYYYAHSNPSDPPSHAKVIAGPGLVTGGVPVRLCAAGKPFDSTTSSSLPSSPSVPFTTTALNSAPLQRRVELLKKYSWCDNNKTINGLQNDFFFQYQISFAYCTC
eukprot:GHVS01108160.1.p1 GENE.GHVS01108160.1~~GHVS01108160.1.p1  ORF type:complete len:148 (+),score=32.53 GHVS01108160.1:240-683(+)